MRRETCGVGATVLCAAVLALAAAAAGETLGALEAVLPAALLHNLEDLVRAASTACELVPAEVFAGGAEPPPLEVVEFSRGGRRALRGPRAARRLRPPPGELPLYVPGWWNSPTDEAARALVAALLARHPTVLVLDTRRSFCRGYLSAAGRVPAVARLLYDFIASLADAGVPPSSLHLIGFSLGAHAAGAAGQLVRRGLKAELGRITALDPARPCFARAERRLRKTDARFVHVVHSSAGVLGLEEPVGHVDVYVNGVAVKQPECRHRSVSFECDHNQAWRAFAASVAAPRALAARRCRSWAALLAAACDGELRPAGYNADAGLRGMYLYKTDR